MYDTITNYNDWNHTPLYNVNIREAIDQVIMEEQAEEKNITVNTSSPQRNKIDNIIEIFLNLTTNDVRNDFIEKKVVNLIINGVGKI